MRDLSNGLPPDYTEEEFRAYSMAAYLREQQAKGFKLVPRDPTPDMMAHWRKGRVITAAMGSQERADAAAVKRWHEFWDALPVGVEAVAAPHPFKEWSGGGPVLPHCGSCGRMRNDPVHTSGVPGTGGEQ